jgi:hypothetical protein
MRKRRRDLSGEQVGFPAPPSAAAAGGRWAPAVVFGGGGPRAQNSPPNTLKFQESTRFKFFELFVILFEMLPIFFRRHFSKVFQHFFVNIHFSEVCPIFFRQHFSEVVSIFFRQHFWK